MKERKKKRKEEIFRMKVRKSDSYDVEATER